MDGLSRRHVWSITSYHVGVQLFDPHRHAWFVLIFQSQDRSKLWRTSRLSKIKHISSPCMWQRQSIIQVAQDHGHMWCLDSLEAVSMVPPGPLHHMLLPFHIGNLWTSLTSDRDFPTLFLPSPFPPCPKAQFHPNSSMTTWIEAGYIRSAGIAPNVQTQPPKLADPTTNQSPCAPVPAYLTLPKAVKVTTMLRIR